MDVNYRIISSILIHLDYLVDIVIDLLKSYVTILVIYFLVELEMRLIKTYDDINQFLTNSHESLRERTYHQNVWVAHILLGTNS